MQFTISSKKAKEIITPYYTQCSQKEKILMTEVLLHPKPPKFGYYVI